MCVRWDHLEAVTCQTNQDRKYTPYSSHPDWVRPKSGEPVTIGCLDRVLDAIRNGHGTPMKIEQATNIPNSSIRLALTYAAATGRIKQERARHPWYLTEEGA
jgi:hypothetical protein